MRKVSSIIPVLYCVILIACNHERQPLLPKVTGKPGEVVVVADEFIWDSQIGKSLYSILTRPFEALPQTEPSYDPIRIPSSAFTNIFKSTYGQNLRLLLIFLVQMIQQLSNT
jgi:hypothetical protein